MSNQGIGNKELSDKSGIPIGTLNKIIYGETKSPTLDNMKAIAKVLNGEEWSEEELDELEWFKAFVRSRREE